MHFSLCTLCPVTYIFFLRYHRHLSMSIWKTGLYLWIPNINSKEKNQLQVSLSSTWPPLSAHGLPLHLPFSSRDQVDFWPLWQWLLLFHANALILKMIDWSQQSGCCVCMASHLLTLMETFGAQIAKHLNLKCLFLGWLLFSSSYQRNSGWSWHINHLSDFIS